MDEREIVEALAERRAAHVLILAVLRGRITEMRCAMPECECPKGRGYFEKKGDPRRGKWAPSADRYPLPGCLGGQYVVDNVRLAHWECNQNDWRRNAKERRRPIPETRRQQWREIGVQNACFVWNIKRGKRCTCGKHGEPWTETVEMPRRGSASISRKAACTLWNIQQGKPCSCGQHTEKPWEEPAPLRPRRFTEAARLKGACVRLSINRGKPCVCGYHGIFHSSGTQDAAQV